MSVCRKCRHYPQGSFVLVSFYGELLVFYRFSSNFAYPCLGVSHKVFIRYFLSVRHFANKVSSSSYGGSLGVEFHNFFEDLRIHLELIEYFDLLSSVYNSNIVLFFIFCLSCTWKKALGHFHSPASNVSMKFSTFC